MVFTRRTLPIETAPTPQIEVRLPKGTSRRRVNAALIGLFDDTLLPGETHAFAPPAGDAAVTLRGLACRRVRSAKSRAALLVQRRCVRIPSPTSNDLSRRTRHRPPGAPRNARPAR